MPSPIPQRTLFLCGATASGKTAIALGLARRFPVEIVNGDAFQLYRGLPNLTAGPSVRERELCPHHLYEVLDPAETCDASRYLALAQPVLEGIAARGRIPLVTGGSGLYLKALTHGLDDIRPVDPALRHELNQLPLEDLRTRLAAVDPASLERIGPLNRRYLQRALEISLGTHQPASALRRAWTADPPGLRGFLVDRPREVLQERIERRVLAMFEPALAEVAAVSSWSLTSLQAIGVREIQAHLRGEIGRDECIRRIQQATHSYAKRQQTWFKREQWLERVVPPADDDWNALAGQFERLLDR